MKSGRGIKIMLAVVLAFVALGFAGYRASMRLLSNVVINIDTGKDKGADSVNTEHFISEADILSIIQEQGDYVNSARLGEIDLNQLENRIKSYSFVADCQVSRDLKGNLIVDVKQNRPVARIITPQGRGFYLGENDSLMPLSSRMAARVMIVSGEGSGVVFSGDSLMAPVRKDISGLLNFIDRDPFWKVQVTQIDIDKKFNLSLFTQVGEQQIIFGEARDYREKLEKLHIFYKKIIPLKGWNAYKKVSLKYKDQIICE